MSKSSKTYLATYVCPGQLPCYNKITEYTEASERHKFQTVKLL